MENDLLIPDQHNHKAMEYIDYVSGMFEIYDFKMCKKIAKELVCSNYWEAYYCNDRSRQEYWRIVLVCFDAIPNNLNF